jgi:hypothetical protein
MLWPQLLLLYRMLVRQQEVSTQDDLLVIELDLGTGREVYVAERPV